MHIHVPKPIHGWKQFFNEVFVIAVGIAIALGGEQLLENWREDHSAEKSLGAIREEVSINLGRMKARAATTDCIARRLDEIAAYIENPASRPRPNWVGRPQVWGIQTSALGAAQSFGSLTVLPREDQMAISDVYSAMAQFADVEKDEQWAWAELRSITEDRALSDNDKANLRGAIQRARYSAWLLPTLSDQATDEARSLDARPNQVDGSQSVCIAMTTPFDQAVKQSSTNSRGEPR